MLGDFDEDEIQDHTCDGTNIAIAPDGRQYCAHCGWRETVKHEAGRGLCHGGSPHYCPNCDRSFTAIAATERKSSRELCELVKEAAEIMEITYAGNFPSGIESFLVRARRAIAAECR